MDSGIELVIQNRTGLHARPAKEFVNLAKKFAADIRVHHGGKKANGKSLVSLLTLGVKRGSSIRIEAEGARMEFLEVIAKRRSALIPPSPLRCRWPWPKWHACRPERSSKQRTRLEAEDWQWPWNHRRTSKS